MNHSSRLEWNSSGHCKYRVMKTRKCEGQPGYSGGCQGSYTDDYGSRQSCSRCLGTGKITYWVFIPVPQFDAPKPSIGWTPDWIEG